MSRRASRADDANAVLVVRCGVELDGHKNGRRADGVPPRLAVYDPIRQHDMKWIIPDLPGQFERHRVLGEVRSGLGFINSNDICKLVLTYMYLNYAEASFNG